MYLGSSGENMPKIFFAVLWVAFLRNMALMLSSNITQNPKCRTAVLTTGPPKAKLGLYRKFVSLYVERGMNYVENSINQFELPPFELPIYSSI